MDNDKIKAICGCGCCMFMTIFILIMTSLTQVQFNEYAFSKAWGQPINQEKVFQQGVHFLGFWNSLVVFPADVVNLNLNDLNVFSKKEGDDTGTTLILDVHMQYFLNPDRLSELFDIGGETGYITQIEAVSIETIKSTTTQFNADAYLISRREIEDKLFEVVSEVLADRFAGTKLETMQLLRVEFPEAFYQRKLEVGLQVIRNEIQEFDRRTEQVRAETEQLVLKKENEAKQIIQTAQANATRIEELAKNRFTTTVGQARDEGMKILAESLGVASDSASEEVFLQLNYLVRMLVNPGTQKKYVNFGDLPPATSLLT